MPHDHLRHLPFPDHPRRGLVTTTPATPTAPPPPSPASDRRPAQASHEQQQAPPTYAQPADEPPAPAPAPPAGPGLTAEAMAQLQQLGALHGQGVLTDEEFAAQKARILG